MHNYGQQPEFVLLGGLVPELLCSGANWQHAGTTDVDIQVDLEVAAGSVNAQRLEAALLRSGFRPDAERAWRWVVLSNDGPAMVKFELLTDQADAPDNSTVRFSGCAQLGAANLRGTGYAARDVEIRVISGGGAGVGAGVEIKVTGVAGFLLAKIAAARARRAAKDWYDIAFVLLHNDLGGPTGAAQLVAERFGGELRGEINSALADLQANFASEGAQGPMAYAGQMSLDNPATSVSTNAADSVTAVQVFVRGLRG